MNIDKALILNVAKNARLHLTEQELEEFVPQFKEILETFSQLNEVTTDNTPLSIHPVEIRNVTREDTPKPCTSQEDILANTKHKKDGYFLGPKAL